MPVAARVNGERMERVDCACVASVSLEFVR